MIKTFRILLILLFSTSLSIAQRSGNFCLFNGNGSWIEVKDNNSLDFTNQVSMDAWVYLCDLDDNYIIASKNHCLEDRFSYYFSVNRGKLFWRWSSDGVCDNGIVYSSNSIVIKKNTWTHVAVSVSSTGIEMFINGSQVSGNLSGGSYSNIYTTNVPLKIGVYQRINNDHAHFFPGKMDNLRIWNKKLSSTEIQSIYQNKLENLQDNLVLYIDMEDVSGGLVRNRAKNGSINDGDVVGRVWFIDNFEFDIGSDTLSCEGNPLSLTIEHHQDASILWNTGHTTFNYTVSSEGTYWAKYSLGKCELYDTLNIGFEQLHNNLIPDTVICEAESVILEAPKEYTSFSWFDNSVDEYKLIDKSGMYWIENYENDCSVIDYFNVEFDVAPVISLGEDINVCSDEIVSVEVKSNLDDFIWNDGRLDNNRIINKSGTFWVKAENYCGTSVDTIGIYIQSKDNPDLIKDTIVCENKFILEVPDFYKPNYTWYNNSKSSQQEILSSGSYWIQFQDDLCIIKDSFQVSFSSAPTFNLAENEIFLCKDEVYEVFLEPNLEANKTNAFWSDSVLTANRKIEHPGFYVLTISNACGSDQDSLEVKLKSLGNVFIPNVITSNGDKFNEYFLIDPKFSNARFELYDRLGTLVFKSDNYENSFSGINLSSSVYYYLLQDGCTQDSFKGWLQLIR